MSTASTESPNAVDNIQSTLVAAARRAQAKIVLPESDDNRILTAAAKAHHDGIAHCILLGDESQVRQQATAAAITLPDDISIFPAPQTWESLSSEITDLADAMVRANSTTAPIAAAALMVRAGLADGMLAGAATATAMVMRPILKIIGKQPNASLASSFFLMELPQGAALFADCALNIRPTAAQLAEIATQSAASATAFGITPIVALLSFATGESASGDEVTRVCEATEAAQKQMPNIPVFGPIQYDAAVSPEIAAIKCPQWPQAGKATVFIFPDLASGNIAYKAVQQSAKIVAVGPLMQGINAPANDLSRGATSEDIYCAIAATAAQCLV